MSGPNYKKLTNVTNKPVEKDVYGNGLWKSGDEFPPFSTRDPAGSGSGPLGVGLGAARAGELETENSLGGQWTEENGSKYCDTCKQAVNIADLATPAHLGHDIRYGDDKTSFDIENVHRTGGHYEVSFDVKPNEAAYAPRPNQSENPIIDQSDAPAGPDTVA